MGNIEFLCKHHSTFPISHSMIRLICFIHIYRDWKHWPWWPYVFCFFVFLLNPTKHRTLQYKLSFHLICRLNPKSIFVVRFNLTFTISYTTELLNSHTWLVRKWWLMFFNSSSESNHSFILMYWLYMLSFV